jgi:hypothetical protein
MEQLNIRRKLGRRRKMPLPLANFDTISAQEGFQISATSFATVIREEHLHGRRFHAAGFSNRID